MTTELTYDLETLAAELADSTTFKAWCGNPKNIESHLCYGSTNASQSLPCVVLSLGPGWQRTRATLTGTDPYWTEPEVMLEFVAAMDDDSSVSEAIFGIMEDVSNIMADLTGGNYQIESWGPADENTPSVTSASAADDYVTFLVFVKGCIRNGATIGGT